MALQKEPVQAILPVSGSGIRRASESWFVGDDRPPGGGGGAPPLLDWAKELFKSPSIDISTPSWLKWFDLAKLIGRMGNLGGMGYQQQPQNNIMQVLALYLAMQQQSKSLFGSPVELNPQQRKGGYGQPQQKTDLRQMYPHLFGGF